MRGIEIRPATDSDAAELQQFATRLFGEDPPGVFRRSIPTLDEEREFIRYHVEPANSTLRHL